jgi:peptide/nickel transport system ATP-binding protein
MGEPVLIVEGLRTHFFTKAGVVKAVDDVSFTVDRGEVLGLVGESGSGKSMTGYSLMGLIDPPGRIVAGRIVLDGIDLRTLPPEGMRHLRGNRVAMIFQDPMMTLNPVLRIDVQMIEAILAHEKVNVQHARSRARDALVKVGIPSPDERLEAYPHQFSGGMRQRVAIAIALLNRPDLIIADEPTTALDVTIQGQILYEMQKLTRETGAAVIWITHDLSVVAGLADRVSVMYAGRIVEQGSCEEVLAHPAHPYTRGLLDSVPANNERGRRLKQIPGMTPSLLDLPPGCPFRERCAYADAECDVSPDMRAIGGSGQHVRCFHPLRPEAAAACGWARRGPTRSPVTPPRAGRIPRRSFSFGVCPSAS